MKAAGSASITTFSMWMREAFSGGDLLTIAKISDGLQEALFLTT
jgi:hypothetical protein